jgi:transcriptional repressor NrdR
VRRRRRCETCSYRFTTYEKSVPAAQVRKRHGAVQPFEPEKVRLGLESALADRPVPVDTVERLVALTEALFDSASSVTTEEIGRVLLEGLREVDEVAYLRFASVYKDFQGASDFEREMAAMENSPEPAG